MGADPLFLTAVTLLLLHEMDAIDKREWRLLFVLRRLPDDGALRWFIVLHLPLFVALLALVAAAVAVTAIAAAAALKAMSRTSNTRLGRRAWMISSTVPTTAVTPIASSAGLGTCRPPAARS